MMSTAAALAILLVASGVIYLAQPKSATVSPQSKSSDFSAAAESPSELDWDAAADATATLSDDIRGLEGRATRLWDGEPLPAANNQTSNPPTSGQPENLP